jgi:AcrR family transcriptional regulator
MKRLANVEGRSYASPLRAEQSQKTRDRILDAAMRVIASGIANVSVPAIAHEAGVSVPTVYRHFRSKSELLAAVYPHVARQAGLDRLPDPTSLDDLRAAVRRFFEQVDSFDDLARAAMASPGAAAVRQATMPSRLQRIGRVTDSIDGDLTAEARARITRLLTVLTTSASLRMWRDHLGASVDQAADDIDFAIKAAVAASQRKQP